MPDNTNTVDRYAMSLPIREEDVMDKEAANTLRECLENCRDTREKVALSVLTGSAAENGKEMT